MSAPATYMYAITRARTGALGEVPGIGGRPVRLVAGRRVGCVVSTVDLEEFGPVPLDDRAADLVWLGRVAREHDAVVRAAAAELPVLPLRLGTVCADDESVRNRVDALQHPAETALDLVAGRAEWGVKLYAVPASPAQAVDAGERPTSGLAYLKQRRAEADRRAMGAAAAAADAERVFNALQELSVRCRRHRLQDAALSGAQHPMLLNAACLVDRDRGAQFHAEVERLAQLPGVGSVVLTGPWPPYSFATIEDA